jgi:hypothetical protein
MTIGVGVLHKTELNELLLQLRRRAEHAAPDELRRAFVAVQPLTSMLTQGEHQVLYGRRGTGKTHILQYLGECIRGEGHLATYVDLRTIGSNGGLYSDLREPVERRATHLLIDVLEALHTALLDWIVADAPDKQDELLDALGRLVDAATQVQVVGDHEVETTVDASSSVARESGVSVDVSARASRLSIAGKSTKTSGRRVARRVKESGVVQANLLFGPLGRALQSFLSALNGRQLWVLLDEWSSVPLELQPYLADLLRRSMFPVRGLVVKIGAIERRSAFRVPRSRDRSQYIGIELGADTSAALNLDDFLVFRNDSRQVEAFFAALLFNHLAVLAGERDRPFPFTTPRELIWAAFRRDAFNELILAAEGVPRDAINLVSSAATLAGQSAISVPNIRQSASDYFIRDKEAAISGNRVAQRTLGKIKTLAIRRNRRTFLLARDDDRSFPGIQDLYDARLIHRRRHGIVQVDNPEKAYDGYVVDYGVYADLLRQGQAALVSDGWTTYPTSLIPSDRFTAWGSSVLDRSIFSTDPASRVV